MDGPDCTSPLVPLPRTNDNNVFVCSIAGLQEIDREQQADKAKLATLETEVATLKTQMASVLARLAALEGSG